MYFNNKLSKIVPYIPLFIMLFYPFLCSYDVSKSSLWTYDFLSMNNNILGFVFFITLAILLVTWGKRDLGLPSLMAIVLLFSVAEIIVNYPLIWRDIFLHGSIVNEIINRGFISDTWNRYALTHPGFFTLWAAFTLITGLDTQRSNLLLLPIAIMLLIILFILIYRKLNITLKNGTALLTFLLMNFNANELTFLHFNTRLLSLIYTLLIFYLFIDQKNKRGVFITIIIINFALVITHILNSLVPIMFLFIYVISYRKQHGLNYQYFFSFTIIYTVWNLYVGYPMFKEGISSFLNYYYLNIAIGVLKNYSSMASKSLPLFGQALGTYYKLLLLILMFTSLYSIIKLRTDKKANILSFYLLSNIIVYGISFFSILSWISIHRGIIFISITLSSLPIILLTSNLKYKISNDWKHKMILISIIVLIIPQFILSHEYGGIPLVRSLNIKSIEASSHYILSYKNDQTIVSLGDYHIFYTFYEPEYKEYRHLNIVASNVPELNSITSFFFTNSNSSLMIISHRNISDWGSILGNTQSYDEAMKEWDKEVYSKMNLHYNQIYSNSYETIYN